MTCVPQRVGQICQPSLRATILSYSYSTISGNKLSFFSREHSTVSMKLLYFSRRNTPLECARCWASVFFTRRQLPHTLTFGHRWFRSELRPWPASAMVWLASTSYLALAKHRSAIPHVPSVAKNTSSHCNKINQISAHGELTGHKS